MKALISAPAVHISHPSTILKKPIKHVFIFILESVRADTVPLDPHFDKVVRSKFMYNVTADDVTPFLNSLWKNSVRTVATTVSSYTLKSLLTTFCGIYPMNVNFLKEVEPKFSFYEACLPELLRQTFPTSKNQSSIRSAFFTAARGDFDHQRELFNKMKFDAVYDGFDVRKRTPKIPDLGPYGPPDSSILPLMWEWIDTRLAEDINRQLMMSLLTTGTHNPFAIPQNISANKYHHYITNNVVNRYLNTLRLSDNLVKEIFAGFKSRGLYDETIFIILSDHGHAFHDWGRNAFGLVDISLECTLLVPLILHNPHLKAEVLDGQFSNMDILPTVIDVLLSSRKTARPQSNHLLSVPREQLQSILSRYEGTSLLRMPDKQNSERYIFYLANPGNSQVIVKQYPRKLVYNVKQDEVYLYDLEHDPHELFDLIHLTHDRATTHADWLEIGHSKRPARNWKGRWLANNFNGTNIHATSLKTVFGGIGRRSRSYLTSNGKVKLEQMLDWADETLELAHYWSLLVMERYLHRNTTIVEDH